MYNYIIQNHQLHTGVYLSLRGTFIVNNSDVIINNIRETEPGTNVNEGLQCITDRRACCRDTQSGNWVAPTGELTTRSFSGGFYRNRGFNDGTVNLNRPENITYPTGRFCCNVVDAVNEKQTLCVNICKYRVVVLVLYHEINNICLCY